MDGGSHVSVGECPATSCCAARTGDLVDGPGAWTAPLACHVTIELQHAFLCNLVHPPLSLSLSILSVTFSLHFPLSLYLHKISCPRLWSGFLADASTHAPTRPAADPHVAGFFFSFSCWILAVREHVDGGGARDGAGARVPARGGEGKAAGGFGGGGAEQGRPRVDLRGRGGGGGAAGGIGGAVGDLVDRRGLVGQLVDRGGLVVGEGGWGGGGGGEPGEGAGGGGARHGAGDARLPGGRPAQQEGALEFLRRQVQVLHEPRGGGGEGGRQGDRQAGEPLQQAPPRAGRVVAAEGVLQLAGHHLPAPSPIPRPHRRGRRRGRGAVGGRGRRRRPRTQQWRQEQVGGEESGAQVPAASAEPPQHVTEGSRHDEEPESERQLL